MEKYLSGKYKIIKTIDRDDSTEVYIVEEITANKRFALRKFSADTSSPLYDTAVKELKEMTSSSFKVDKEPDSPTIIDFFSEEGQDSFLKRLNADILTHGPDQAMADFPEVPKHLTFELIGDRLIRR